MNKGDIKPVVSFRLLYARHSCAALWPVPSCTALWIGRSNHYTTKPQV